MLKKAYQLRGLDLRSNPLTRQEGTASDCDNVRLNSKRQLIKREEFDALNIPRDLLFLESEWETKLPTPAKIIAFTRFDGNYIIIAYYEALVAPLQRNAVYKWDGSSTTMEKIPGQSGYSGINSPAKFFEKDNCLYWTHSGQGSGEESSLFKYDGISYYRSGVENIPSTGDDEDEGTLSGSDYYVISIPMYIDNKGNQTFGARLVEKKTATADVISYGRNYYPSSDLNAVKFAVNGNQTLDSSNLTIDAFSIDAEVGNYVYYYEDSGQILYRFIIEDITSGVVTVANPETYSGTSDPVWLSVDMSIFSLSITNFEYFSSWFIVSYFSRDYTIGYTFGGLGIPQGPAGFEPVSYDVTAPDTLPSWALFSNRLEDFYDLNFIKFKPQNFKSVAQYGNAIVACDDNFVYYSDTSINGRIENFTAFENFSVGSEEDGVMNGVFANETFVALFRERESFFLSGNLLTGNFSVRAYRSTKIGCSSPSSITKLAGQCIFSSERGIFMAQENGSMSELSDVIEPLFLENELGLDPDTTTVQSVIDYKNEYLLFSLVSNVEDSNFTLIYSYYFKEWFIYKDIDASGGIIINDNRNILYSDQDEIYEVSTEYTNGVNAFYKSNFETLGESSFRKRFQSITLHLSDLYSAVFGIKAFRDYKDTPYTDETITSSAYIPIDVKRLDRKLTYSTAMQIESSGTNSLIIDGYEYNFEIEQTDTEDANR